MELHAFLGKLSIYFLNVVSSSYFPDNTEQFLPLLGTEILEVLYLGSDL